jgi:hypothetical protein
MRRLRDRVMSGQSGDCAMAGPWLQPTLGGERRWAARTEVHFDVTFRAIHLARLDVEIVNFSRFGCALSGTPAPALGAYCWLTIPTLQSWHATVAWQDENGFGLDFVDPFHPAVAAMIVDRAGAAPTARPVALLA